MCAESSVEVMQAREKLESVRNAGVTPDPELNQHRSNSVSFHTLFGDASKTGARCFRTKRIRGNNYVCMGSGY
jgi:hypothetical protein